MASNSERDRTLREARDEFCRHRRASFLQRWMSWIGYRAVLERWPCDVDLVAEGILVEAEKWRRGFRPPTSFHEANGRIRRGMRDGTLRLPFRSS